jgi:hypothetical protein
MSVHKTYIVRHIHALSSIIMHKHADMGPRELASESHHPPELTPPISVFEIGGVRPEWSSTPEYGTAPGSRR